MEVTLPIEFAAQLADRALLSQSQQSPQTQFNGFALGLQAGGAKGVTHQPVIDDDVSPHDVYIDTQ